MSAVPAEIPEDDPGWPRYEQTSEEWLEEWKDASLARLSALYEPPWNDAAPPDEESSTLELCYSRDMTKNVNALLEDDQYERLRKAAFRARRAMTDILREALEDWLARYETEPGAGNE